MLSLKYLLKLFLLLQLHQAKHFQQIQVSYFFLVLEKIYNQHVENMSELIHFEFDIHLCNLGEWRDASGLRENVGGQYDFKNLTANANYIEYYNLYYHNLVIKAYFCY